MPNGERERAVRVTVCTDGPMLVEGPVEVALPDGRVVRSDRFTAAVCLCGRSARYPWCDTSHRHRRPGARRKKQPPGSGEEPGSGQQAGPGGEKQRPGSDERPGPGEPPGPDGAAGSRRSAE